MSRGRTVLNSVDRGHPPLQFTSSIAIANEDHRWDIKLLQMICNSADVVFMTVGNDHAFNLVAIFAQIRHVRQNYIHPVHVFGRKSQPCIQDDNFVVVLENAGIFTNFMQTARGIILMAALDSFLLMCVLRLFSFR